VRQNLAVLEVWPFNTYSRNVVNFGLGSSDTMSSVAGVPYCYQNHVIQIQYQ